MAEIRIGILTASDSCAAGDREDTAGHALAGLCEARGWQVGSYHVCPDDLEALSTSLIEMAEAERVDVVLTCGGTGFGPRDSTPEATALACERMAPGIAEAIRAESLAITKRAMLSRGTAGIRGKTLVINLPGSEKAARETFAVVADQLEHAVEMMGGGGHD
ncbi:MAG TPA: MogA/MoaB family molybdenum cofactor biosynthesis protein [Coriobacteriia bacterium]